MAVLEDISNTVSGLEVLNLLPLCSVLPGYVVLYGLSRSGLGDSSV